MLQIVTHDPYDLKVLLILYLKQPIRLFFLTRPMLILHNWRNLDIALSNQVVSQFDFEIEIDYWIMIV